MRTNSIRYRFVTLSLAAALSIATSSAPVCAQRDPSADFRYQKAGLPCVEEVCLGDGLAALRSIAWEPITWTRRDGETTSNAADVRLSEDQLVALGRAFVGNLPAVGPYLQASRFDASAVEKLEGVTASCTTNRLYGRYVSAGGDPTRVALSLVRRDSRAPNQEWTVVEITREFVHLKSDQDEASVFREVRSRYRRWDETLTGAYRGASQASFSLYTVGSPTFTLVLPISENLDAAGCKATRVVNAR